MYCCCSWDDKIHLTGQVILPVQICDVFAKSVRNKRAAHTASSTNTKPVTESLQYQFLMRIKLNAKFILNKSMGFVIAYLHATTS